MVGQYSLWVICEALDAIFDIFADGPLVNAAADSIGLMINLQQLVPVLKARVRNSLMYAGGVCLSYIIHEKVTYKPVFLSLTISIEWLAPETSPS